MIEVLQRLKRGDQKVAAAFKDLEGFWAKTLANVHSQSVQSLADLLSNSQWEVEQIAGSRDLGKEIMAWSAFSHLYDSANGFGDKLDAAKNLSQAFANSHCSLEVKHEAEAAAQVFMIAS